MNERELGRSLLDLDAAGLSGVPDVRQQTWTILERDRRRVRRLTGLTIVAWLLSMAMILAVLVHFGLLFPKVAKLRMDDEAGRVTATERDQVRAVHAVALQKGTLGIAFSVAFLALAALCTVALNHATRRATLRQINASLVEISEQLKALRGEVGRAPSLGP